MNDQAVIEQLNARLPGFIPMLGGKIVAIDREERNCTFEFAIGTDFCHSIDVVQGGFITSMLDAAMSHAVFATAQDIVDVSTLQINTSYLEVTRAGRLRAVGNVVKSSYKTAFLEGRLYNEDGLLVATTSATAKLSRKS
ncbi:MAG: PaaI family thioesterase [Gammaproteobacteria bacterium]|nr:PaaI family thioesterase [Gammaproteobacteria bacterium]